MKKNLNNQAKLGLYDQDSTLMSVTDAIDKAETELGINRQTKRANEQ
jgi:hypothetical protein